MLKQRFAREFEHAAIRELNELGIYQLIEKKQDPSTPEMGIYRLSNRGFGPVALLRSQLSVCQ